MGVDTKGFVVTRCKNVMLVGALLERTLNSLIRLEKEAVFGEKAFYGKAALEQFRTPELRLSPSIEGVSIHFRFAGEDRDLKVFFSCDSDHENVAPNSLSLILGYWGKSSLYMQYALHALSVLGPAYYDECDSDNIDYASLRDPRVNVLQAIALGYIAKTEFSNWVNAWDRGELANGVSDMSFEEFFGIEESEARELLSLHYEECWNQIKALAKELEAQDLAPPCRALMDYQAQKAQEEEHEAQTGELASAA